MVSKHVDKLICEAITQKRLLKVTYQRKSRIIEPHDYGVHNEVVKLLSYQLAGSSSGPLPNWRWIEVDGITEIEMLERKFRGGRPNKSGKHHQWDELYLRVDSPDEED